MLRNKMSINSINQILFILIFSVSICTIRCHSPFKNRYSYRAYSVKNPPSYSTNLKQLPVNPFLTVYEWNQLDFVYPSIAERQEAIATGEFEPENNLPLGVDRWKDRLFVTTPRWKNGVPASLSWLPLPAIERSPPLRPYPNWFSHGDPLSPDCSKLMSVYRLWIDECDRLWVLDAGVVNATIKINQVCPPKIVVFDLHTDEQLYLYEIPGGQVKEDSLHSNIIVDIRNGQCDDAYAYVTDVWRFGIVVFSLAKNRSWRTTNHLYMPNPLASDYTLHGLNFQWTDGVFGISLSPLNEYSDRLMFFHPMSSYAEFIVTTSVLRNETIWENGGLPSAFVKIGDRFTNGQSSTSGIARNNVMFFNLIHLDAVGCWDISKPYTLPNLGIIAQNNETLVFPNDMKLDREANQGLWVLSNRLPIYLYSKLDYTDINFRIHWVDIHKAVAGTICDPQKPPVWSSDKDSC